MMNSVVRKAWVVGLRSGRYKQGRLCLCQLTDYDEFQYNAKEDKRVYCCMGVLADIVNPDGWSNSDERPGRPYMFKVGDGIESDDGTHAGGNAGGVYCLSNKLLNKIGLSARKQDRLMAMNDGLTGRRYTFDEIADFIEGVDW